MCFSNLPVEFDDQGDPYLADDADEVSEPGECDHDHGDATIHGCGCGEAADAALDADPEEAFEEILESVTDATRTHLTGTTDPDDGTGAVRGRNSAEGD